MVSWVYLFSQFTPEALLIEALIILLLCCGYTSFWVLRKRRYGAVDAALPSGPVKTYLTELITNAEQLRLQLFGLLSATDPRVHQASRGIDALPSAAAGAVAAAATLPSFPTSADPQMAAKLAALEAKMTEQAMALQTIAVQKAQLEKELAQAKIDAVSQAQVAPSSGASSGGAEAKEVPVMKQKIQELEGKLAEYSIIEDDLANLKRLQQENAQLKAALAANNSGFTLPPSADPSPALAGERKLEPAPSSPDQSGALENAFAGNSEPSGVDPFESLIGQVDSSLKQANPGAGAQPSSPDAAPSETRPPSPPKEEEEELVAEFEKMLKG